MSYCTTDDIKADFSNITFDADSKVTLTQLESYIESESNYIDSYIASKYKVPVIEPNSPSAFSMLKRIAIFRVSDRVRNIIEIKTGDNQTDQDAKGQSRTPTNDLKLIIDGKLKLIDAEIASSDDGLSYGLKDDVSNPFNLNLQQW